jgi:SHS2 domain-containing protein
MSRGFELFEHTAEMGLRAWAPTLEEAFAEVARGMFAVILDLETVEERLTRRVAVVATDAEELVVRWLNEFVFLLDTERLVFRSFRIERFSRWSIDATARGEQLDRARHQPRAEVKSATYYRLVVEEGPPARIEVILDI